MNKIIIWCFNNNNNKSNFRRTLKTFFKILMKSIKKINKQLTQIKINKS
jgi:hypothetical protein